MDRERLFAEIRAARPAPGDLVYVERRGGEYAWSPAGARRAPGPADGFPDVWIYYSGSWPPGDGEALRAVLDDLLEEMESKTGGADRCRWPFDDPWPRHH